MELPQFGQQPQAQYYQLPPQQPQSKRKFLLLAVGGILVLVTLIALLLSGGGPQGQQTMAAALDPMSDALAITDEYEGDLTDGPTKNDIALVQILLRGNFQTLNDIYNDVYSPKKKLSATPKITEADQEELDRSERNNTLDDDIVIALSNKIEQAQSKLSQVSSVLPSKDDQAAVKTSLQDMESIQDILNRAR